MYNFDKIVCRKGSGCVKWDAKLPMGVNSGHMYGSDGYIRINLACPRALLKEALRRIASVL